MPNIARRRHKRDCPNEHNNLDQNLAFTLGNFSQHVTAFFVAHPRPPRNFLSAAMTTNTNVILVQRANAHTGRAYLIGDFHPAYLT
jgi:hypothetical protein